MTKPIIDVPRSLRRRNDKFVNVNVIEAETCADLIRLVFYNHPPIYNMSWTEKTEGYYMLHRALLTFDYVIHYLLQYVSNTILNLIADS